MQLLDWIKRLAGHPQTILPDDDFNGEYKYRPFKVVIVEFADNVESRSGENIALLMKEKEGLNVSYFDEPFAKSFLNLESRSLFDLIDKGQTILEKTKTDVLVWGYREDNKIRLNFQTANQYEKDDSAFISLLDSLYIPTDLAGSKEIFPPALANLIYGSIVSAVNAADKENKIRKRFLLKKIIDLLSRDNSAKSLSVEYMPYIMNFLGIIYLSYAYDRGSSKDYKIVKNLFETAISHQVLIKNPIHLGCIYNHLAQLYDTTDETENKRVESHFKKAIKYYRLAQKYLSKYNYPYDYGYISYKLAHLFFSYWRQKGDIQALRDAVFQLREAEKIYTYALFPGFWATIQGELAHLLSLLGSFSNSEEISELAISCYKNRQKVITEHRDPLSWAQIQQNIGEIYYRLGKNSDDKALLEESLEYFHDALYIFENMELKEDAKKITANIAKASHAINAA